MKSRLLFTSCLHALTTQLSKVGSVSFILGSHGAYFSLSHCIAPLIGVWQGASASLLVFALRTFWSLTQYGMLFSLLHHLPSLVGALYLAWDNRLFRAAVPLACMIIFITHPIGSQASLYACYWLLPLVIALISPESIFLRSLASTFAVHAVGSVIWLYSHDLTAAHWQALIAVVWLERLVLAAGMTLVYYGALHLQHAVKNLRLERFVALIFFRRA